MPVRDNTAATVAGQPGSGKSVGINGLLLQWAPSPACQFGTADGKSPVDGGDYEVWRPRAWRTCQDSREDTADMLSDACKIMRERLGVVAEVTGSRNAWHQGPTPGFPLFGIVLDECQRYLDATVAKRDKELERLILQIQQMAGDIVRQGRSVLIVPDPGYPARDGRFDTGADPRQRGPVAGAEPEDHGCLGGRAGFGYPRLPVVPADHAAGPRVHRLRAWPRCGPARTRSPGCAFPGSPMPTWRPARSLPLTSAGSGCAADCSAGRLARDGRCLMRLMRRGRHQAQLVWLTVAQSVLVLRVVAEARRERYRRAALGWCPACQLSPSLTCQAHAVDLAEVDALGEVANVIRTQLPEESAT